MGSAVEFDYYYGIEAEQFSFYRVPRLLIRDERFKGLSSDAKLLYGLMLDRMALSMKNGWLDDKNRAYIIYAVENIMEDLGCSKPTCIKIMRELDADKGIGLIEKKRRGLGKPDIIYVKNFASISEKEAEEKPANADDPTEVKDFAHNYNNTNHNDQSYIGRNHINHIDQSGSSIDHQDGKNKDDMIDTIDGMDDTAAYMALIRDNLEYDHHMRHDRHDDKEIFEEIYETVCDIVCVRRSMIRINGEYYPYELVKSRFLKLNSSHVEYVMGCMKDTATKIKNIRSYLITALYNAPSTINYYYQQEVRYDMYGGGWEEKG